MHICLHLLRIFLLAVLLVHAILKVKNLKKYAFFEIKFFQEFCVLLRNQIRGESRISKRGGGRGLTEDSNLLGGACWN